MAVRDRAEGLVERSAAIVADRDRLLGLLEQCTDSLSRTPSLARLPSRRLMVVGDLHGHMGAAEWVARHALAAGRPDVVALGDYADRGDRQLETLVLMLGLMLELPGSVTLLRGNHETRSMASRFGLEEAVLSVHDREVMDAIYRAFAQMPFAAHRADGVLCLHGGIPGGARALEDLSTLPKGEEEPVDGTAIEVLWNDAEERAGFHAFNRARGVGQTFGLDASRAFMERNGLWLLVRAHQPSEHGFARLHGGRVVSVFSHPGYLGGGTEGSVAIVGTDRTVRRARIRAGDRAIGALSEPTL